MKQFPQQALIRVREHRANRALREVLERKAALAARIEERDAVQRRLGAIRYEEATVAERMAASGTGRSAPSIATLTRCVDRLGLLRDRRIAVLSELEKADIRIAEARQALAASIRAYRQAQAKCDSAQEQRQIWVSRQLRLDDSRDEDATDDHVANRFVRREQLQ